jgi:hypothetical protein
MWELIRKFEAHATPRDEQKKIRDKETTKKPPRGPKILCGYPKTSPGWRGVHYKVPKVSKMQKMPEKQGFQGLFEKETLPEGSVHPIHPVVAVSSS